MCFSVAGRLQTRLAALLAPALIAALIILRTGDPRYLTMFIVMTLVAIDLDVFLYARAFRYQPRWTIYPLGLFEFFVTFGIVRWLAGTLLVSDIVRYYVASWILGQLLINVVLPLLDPVWAEHGGELWRPTSAARASRPLTRAWSYLRRGDPALFLISAASFFGLLNLTVLPSTLTALDVALALAGAAAAALLVRLIMPADAPPLDEAIAMALILSVLLRGPAAWVYFVAAALAVCCRAWLRIEGRPAFNGVACAYVLAILVVPGMYTADGEWGNSLLLPLVALNLALLLTSRTGRLPLLLSFLAVVVADGFARGFGHHDAIHVIVPRLLPVWLLVFAAFVLPDVATTAKRFLPQVATGVAVALAGIALAGIGLHFVLALLLVNYITALVVLARALAPQPRTRPISASGVSRRRFLTMTASAAGAAIIGGSLRRLEALDPAVLSLPADPALAGGAEIPVFTDVAAQAGIVLSHQGDRAEGSPAVGTGVAWGDYDRDGKLDIYVTNHMGACHLYRNNGDGTFTDVAEEAGVAHPGMHATSATFVDYDNNGWPDLYVGIAFGPNRMYRNNGNGTFTDVTEKTGLGDKGRTMSTAWADYDGDGYLDVFVANYPDIAITFDANSSPEMNTRQVLHMPAPTNRLFHNNGNGTFTDVTRLLGDGTNGFGFSAVWFDYNGDGRPDLYVAYDFGNVRQPSTLWRNDGPGPNGWRFTEVQGQLHVDTQMNPMGVASGDYDNDGWLDIAETNIGASFLYHNEQGRGFKDVAERAGVSHGTNNINNMMDASMTWGVAFADFNNDGWLDLYLVAGAMDYQNVPQPNGLYMNDHTGKFVDISAASGANDAGQGRSVAVADFDGDGYLDMLVANYAQPPLLYRNVSRSLGNRWLRLNLEGTQGNRDAAGARVTVHVAGMRPQMREVQVGQGLGSCNERTLHFGLGRADRTERVEIRWPGGSRQILHDVNANQTVHVLEPGPSRWV